MTISLELLKLRSNPNAKIILTLPEGGFIEGFVEQDFNFAMGSTYSEGQEEIAGQAEATNIANDVANTTGAFGQVLVRNIRQTVSNWTGPTKPTFDVPLTLISYDTSQNIMADVQKLFEGVAADENGLLLLAPGGYTASFFNEDFATNPKAVVGTWTLKIGQWLVLPRLLLTTVSCQFSKEVTSFNNKPLYVRLQLSFTPAILPTKKQVGQYFNGG